MSFENKLPRGYQWQGFLGGSFNRSKKLAESIALQYRNMGCYKTKVIKIKTKNDGIYYGVAMKMIHGKELLPGEELTEGIDY